MHNPIPHSVLRVFRVVPSPPEHSRHAPHDALDARRCFLQGSGLPDQLQQAVEGQQHAVIVLRGGDLEEAAVGGEGQEPALLAGHRAAVPQVPLVPHDDDGGPGRRAGTPPGPAPPEPPHLLLHHGEAGAVADAVDQDEAVGPLELFGDVVIGNALILQ